MLGIFVIDKVRLYFRSQNQANMKNRYNRLIVKMRYLLLVALFGVLAFNANADHFRYGNLTWQRVPGQPLKIRYSNKMSFKITQFGAAFTSSVHIGTVVAV